MEEMERRARVCAALAEHRLPGWDELPDLELYMDQVLSLVDRYLRDYPGYDARGLTASMVNNYVKLGVMPAPVKKRYTRIHLAHLLMICVLKASLPMTSLQKLCAAGRGREREMYEGFRRSFQEESAAAAASCLAQDGVSEREAALRCALRAQAEQALGRKLLEEQA